MEHSMDHKSMYIKFAVMIALSFVAMYAFMYAMVDVFTNVIPNYNQFYMAGLMTAPMIILEMGLMWMMYPHKKLNVAIILGGVLLLVICWVGIRQQVAIGDEQFLKSMIPHHAGAILMCEKAKLIDPEIKALCANIVSGQAQEIDQMRAVLERIDS
jgi:uncharacterized protein (DUF305 family)